MTDLLTKDERKAVEKLREYVNMRTYLSFEEFESQVVEVLAIIDNLLNSKEKHGPN